MKAITHPQPKLSKILLPLIMGLTLIFLGMFLAIHHAVTGSSINNSDDPDTMYGFAIAFVTLGLALLHVSRTQPT